MAEIKKDNLFKPSSSNAESKYDATTRAARAIIEKQSADRDAKTDRLRAARLAKEAAEAEAPPPAPVKRASRARKVV